MRVLVPLFVSVAAQDLFLRSRAPDTTPLVSASESGGSDGNGICCLNGGCPLVPRNMCRTVPSAYSTCLAWSEDMCKGAGGLYCYPPTSPGPQQPLSPNSSDSARTRPKLPKRILGMYLLVADDTTNYTSTSNWQPVLHPYQQVGANVLFLAFLNPTHMPNLPPAFANLARTRGSSKPGSVPASTVIIASIGGESYSHYSWTFLMSASAARAAGAQVATWWDSGIDGIDLDLEQGIGDQPGVGRNLIEFIKAIKEKAPDFIITVPKDGGPNCVVTNYLINNGWDAKQQPLGLVDRVGIMWYTCQESLCYAQNYAGAHVKNWPIEVDIPKKDVLVGIGGGDSAKCITDMAKSVMATSLGGMMVWFATVMDAATGKRALWSNTYDASIHAYDAWAEAVHILR